MSSAPVVALVVYGVDEFHCELELYGRVGRVVMVPPVAEILVVGSEIVDISGEAVGVVCGLVVESVMVEISGEVGEVVERLVV